MANNKYVYVTTKSEFPKLGYSLIDVKGNPVAYDGNSEKNFFYHGDDLITTGYLGNQFNGQPWEYVESNDGTKYFKIKGGENDEYASFNKALEDAYRNTGLTPPSSNPTPVRKKISPNKPLIKKNNSNSGITIQVPDWLESAYKHFDKVMLDQFGYLGYGGDRSPRIQLAKRFPHAMDNWALTAEDVELVPIVNDALDFTRSLASLVKGDPEGAVEHATFLLLPNALKGLKWFKKGEKAANAVEAGVEAAAKKVDDVADDVADAAKKADVEKINDYSPDLSALPKKPDVSMTSLKFQTPKLRNYTKEINNLQKNHTINSFNHAVGNNKIGMFRENFNIPESWSTTFLRDQITKGNVTHPIFKQYIISKPTPWNYFQSITGDAFRTAGWGGLGYGVYNALTGESDGSESSTVVNDSIREDTVKLDPNMIIRQEDLISLDQVANGNTQQTQTQEQVNQPQNKKPGDTVTVPQSNNNNYSVPTVKRFNF